MDNNNNKSNTLEEETANKRARTDSPSTVLSGGNNNETIGILSASLSTGELVQKLLSLIAFFFSADFLGLSVWWDENGTVTYRDALVYFIKKAMHMAFAFSPEQAHGLKSLNPQAFGKINPKVGVDSTLHLAAIMSLWCTAVGQQFSPSRGKTGYKKPSDLQNLYFEKTAGRDLHNDIFLPGTSLFRQHFKLNNWPVCEINDNAEVWNKNVYNMMKAKLHNKAKKAIYGLDYIRKEAATNPTLCKKALQEGINKEHVKYFHIFFPTFWSSATKGGSDNISSFMMEEEKEDLYKCINEWVEFKVKFNNRIPGNASTTQTE
jgi:hypothetical protein